MGKRGPKPAPTALKIANGVRSDRINFGEPPPVEGDFEPTADLNVIAQKEWDRLLPILKKMGVLSAGDASALTVLCVSFARWVQAERDIEDNGLTFQDDRGRDFPNPSLAISKEMVAVVAKYQAAFGLTPSARSSIKAAPGDASGGDEIEDFKRRRAT